MALPPIPTSKLGRATKVIRLAYVQIRAHLEHIGHPIANDDLYHGTEEHTCRYEHHGTSSEPPMTVYTDDDAGTLAAIAARPDVYREWCPKVLAGYGVVLYPMPLQLMIATLTVQQNSAARSDVKLNKSVHIPLRPSPHKLGLHSSTPETNRPQTVPFWCCRILHCQR